MRLSTDSYHRQLVIVMGITLMTLLVASLAFPKGEDVRWINGMNSEFADRFFAIVTYAGDARIFIPVILILLFVRFADTLIVVAACAGHGICCSILKRLVFGDVPRPTAVLDHSLLHFVPGVDVHAHYSFPSGHTATAFCFAVVLALVTRKRFVLYIGLLLATLVALSRVYLLQHFLIDVAAGAIVGTGIAYLSWFLFDKYGKAEWLGGRLELRLKRSVRPDVPARAN